MRILKIDIIFFIFDTCMQITLHVNGQNLSTKVKHLTYQQSLLNSGTQHRIGKNVQKGIVHVWTVYRDVAALFLLWLGSCGRHFSN